MKAFLNRVHWILSSQFGLNFLYFLRSIRGLPRFLLDWREFSRRYSGSIELMPCLHDRYEEGGSTKSEYFWQDLLVARWIFQARPERHIDVGSRIDGFVAHVASFRQIEVFDVRSITSTVPGVVFRKADLMSPIDSMQIDDECCDSLSCLHAIEHFGLGRYGDPINPIGYELGIANMARLLRVGGRLYLSTPVGRERVEFNANRVFDPRTILRCAEAHGLRLESFTEIGASGAVGPTLADAVDFSRLAQFRYQLGIFVFVKENSRRQERANQ